MLAEAVRTGRTSIHLENKSTTTSSIFIGCLRVLHNQCVFLTMVYLVKCSGVTGDNDLDD